MINRGTRKSIIFGVNGYIGKHLADVLLKRGDELTGYDIQPEPLLTGLNCYYSGNLDNSETWNTIALDCDEIYWMCGLTGTGASFDRYQNFLQVNELLLLNLLDSLRRRELTPRVFFPSTRLVYRGSEMLLKEDAPKETKTLYAVNKIACENILSAYWNAFTIPYTVMRICVPYGSRFGAVFSYGTMGLFHRQATEDHRITLWGNGLQRRTFTHIDDLCTQILALMDDSSAIGEVFNSAGEEYSLKDIAEMFAQKYKVPIEYKPFPALAEKLESDSTVFDATKLKALLGETVLRHKIVELFQ